jgi:hypothetical protein
LEADESDVLKRVRDIAVSRKEHGIPLKTLTLSSRGVEHLLDKYGGVIEELRSCVGKVEMMEDPSNV